MTRNLKALGLVLMAALALSAVVVSAASAESALLTAGVEAGETAKVTGGQLGPDTISIGVGGAELTCATATVEGETLTAGTGSTKVTLTPHYSICHAIITILGAKVTRTATVTMNGCDYVFNATKNTASTPFSADLTVNCFGTNKIQIHVYTTSAEPHNNSVLCTYDIGSQTIYDAIELTNIAGVPDHIQAYVRAWFALTNTIPNATCTTSNSAEYVGTETLKAFNKAGKQVNLTVS